jgi:DNA polymerase I-like protein with 3'-5' exonuclease and polymerase domains
VLDFETTTLKKYKCKANPFYNKMVAAVFAANNEFKTLYGKPLRYEEFKSYIEWAHLLVGHNLSFDLLYIWGEEHFQEWIRRGGRIWDTQAVEHILTGQQEKYKDLALRRIAVDKYGCDRRKKGMESYWDKSIDTINIPKHIVIEDVLSDGVDTLQVFLKQQEKVKELKLEKLVELRMDSLLATIEMRWNGFKVDKERLQENKKDLEDKLQLVDLKLLNIVGEYWKCLN